RGRAGRAEAEVDVGVAVDVVGDVGLGLGDASVAAHGGLDAAQARAAALEVDQAVGAAGYFAEPAAGAEVAEVSGVDPAGLVGDRAAGFGRGQRRPRARRVGRGRQHLVAAVAALAWPQ